MNRQKRAHNKTRSGCVTCKQRRVKCDEVRPRCTRCQTRNIECEYAPPKPWIFQPSGEWEERRALAYFREKTGPLFGGDHIFSKEFFVDFVPQVAASDLAVWHLTIAMGSRHEGTQIADKHHSAGLWIMSRSLSQMPIDVALLCCLLVGAHGNLAGEDPTIATYHMVRGLKILQEAGPSENLNRFLSPMLADLELCVAFYAPQSKCLCPLNEKRPELVFDNILDARRLFFDVLRWRLIHKEDMIEEWRQQVLELKDPRAQTMLFHAKLLTMCDAAKNYQSRVKVLLVDLSDRGRIDVVCSLKSQANSNWRPLEQHNSSQTYLSLWPKGTVTGIDGDMQVIRISLMREVDIPLGQRFITAT